MKQLITIIESNQLLCESMLQLDFRFDAASEFPQPGQFFSMRVINSISPLLRRPFAFSSFDEKNFLSSCIYQVRGSATEILSGLAEKAPIDLIGPLGKPFPLPNRSEKPLLIAGGIGLGPILFLSRQLQSIGIDHQLIFGCRSVEFFPESAFENLPVTVCTDNGSKGFQGTVIDYLVTISSKLPLNTVLYCCGPHPMLSECHSFAVNHKIRCTVSVEQTMACGVGACMGCAIKVQGAQAYVRACKEGPVFESRDLIWE